MNADLGARLLAAGLVTREELGMALSSVPTHGGALAAELVRRGVEEDAIAGFFVADGFGPVVGAPELRGAVEDGRVPPRLAVDMLALPLRQSSSGLVVAMADPSDVHAVRELTHAAGVTIVPTVARIGALLAALAQRFPGETADAERRRARDPVPIALVRRRSTGPADGDSIRASFDSIVPLSPASTSAPIFPPVPRELNESGRKRRETADLLRVPAPAPPPPRKRRDTASFADGESAAPEPSGRRRRDTADFQSREVEDELEALDASEPAPRDTLVDPPGRTTLQQITQLVGPLAPRDEGGGWGDLSEPSPVDHIARRAARAHSILPQRLPTAPRASLLDFEAGPRELGDLSAVLSTIRAAKTRDEVCRHACRGLAPLGRTAVLLVLSRGILKGREVVGGDLPRDAVHNLWIPSTSRSLLSRVLETTEPYLGPHGQSSADAVFRAALGSRGGDVLLIPIVLSGRSVAVLALDEPLADAVVLLERAEVLSRATAEAFRRLIAASKAHS